MLDSPQQTSPSPLMGRSHDVLINSVTSVTASVAAMVASYPFDGARLYRQKHLGRALWFPQDGSTHIFLIANAAQRIIHFGTDSSNRSTPVQAMSNLSPPLSSGFLWPMPFHTLSTCIFGARWMHAVLINKSIIILFSFAVDGAVVRVVVHWQKANQRGTTGMCLRPTIFCTITRGLWCGVALSSAHVQRSLFRL